MIAIKWVEARQLPPSHRDTFNRPWPAGWYGHTGKFAVQIDCRDSYDPEKAASGDHAPLTLSLVDHSTRLPDYNYIQKGFLTLRELKEAVPELLEQYNHFIPNLPRKLTYANHQYQSRSGC
jgi:hypothetical protein